MTDDNQDWRRQPRPSAWRSKFGPSKHALPVRLSRPEYVDAIRAAKAEGGSVSDFLRAAIRERAARVLGDADARPRIRR